jgi:hypothetical protein
MKVAGKIKVLFIAGFGPIVRETATSRKLYSEALGIPFKEESGGYIHTEALQGVKTFALLSLVSSLPKDYWSASLSLLRCGRKNNARRNCPSKFIRP